VIVSPDIGGVKRADKMADLLGLKLAIIDKFRKSHDAAEVTHVVGDVEGKRAVIVDDVISTGGSVCAAAEALKKSGAWEVIVCATHGVLSNNPKKMFDDSCVDKILLTDTIPIPPEKISKKMKIITVGPLLAKVIGRISREKSLGELFTWEDRKMGL
jgi:ribose-phosphate pyrophosphokinase